MNPFFRTFALLLNSIEDVTHAVDIDILEVGHCIHCEVDEEKNIGLACYVIAFS